ncbi:MAG: hypothetical protein ACYC4S_18760 [Rhodoferax sp.]
MRKFEAQLQQRSAVCHGLYAFGNHFAAEGGGESDDALHFSTVRLAQVIRSVNLTVPKPPLLLRPMQDRVTFQRKLT